LQAVLVANEIDYPKAQPALADTGEFPSGEAHSTANAVFVHDSIRRTYFAFLRCA
jgi:hypothetical protein